MKFLDVLFTLDIRFIRLLRSYGHYLCALGLHVHYDIFAHPGVDGMTSSLHAMSVKKVPYCVGEVYQGLSNASRAS